MRKSNCRADAGVNMTIPYKPFSNYRTGFHTPAIPAAQPKVVETKKESRQCNACGCRQPIGLIQAVLAALFGLPLFIVFALLVPWILTITVFIFVVKAIAKGGICPHKE